LSNSIDLPAALSELRTDHVFVLEQELGNVKQSVPNMERLCAAMSGFSNQPASGLTGA